MVVVAVVAITFGGNKKECPDCWLLILHAKTIETKKNEKSRTKWETYNWWMVLYPFALSNNEREREKG